MKGMTYEQAHSNPEFKAEAIMRFNEGNISAAEKKIDPMTPMNQAVNLCFHAVLINHLFDRVCALEKYIVENMDGNRFTKGSDL